MSGVGNRHPRPRPPAATTAAGHRRHLRRSARSRPRCPRRPTVAGHHRHQKCSSCRRTTVHQTCRWGLAEVSAGFFLSLLCMPPRKGPWLFVPCTSATTARPGGVPPPALIRLCVHADAVFVVVVVVVARTAAARNELQASCTKHAPAPTDADAAAAGGGGAAAPAATADADAAAAGGGGVATSAGRHRTSDQGDGPRQEAAAVEMRHRPVACAGLPSNHLLHAAASLCLCRA